VFFQHETERLGWQEVLSEYMFKGDERSEDMMIRMLAGTYNLVMQTHTHTHTYVALSPRNAYSTCPLAHHKHPGAVHPIIQLMYGVEWQQPAIVAMALAQASVHRADYRDFYLEAEKLAAANNTTTTTSIPTIASLIQAMRDDPTLQAARQPGDGAGNQQHVVDHAGPAAAAIAARVRVRADGADLDERTAEMYHTAVYLAASAAVHGDKDAKFEFFLMHHVNVAPIFVTLHAQPWIPTAAKVRLLEWKIRLDLLNYVARGMPALDFAHLRDYVPQADRPGPLADILPRIHDFVDDGHTVKLFRAIGIGRHICQPYEERGCDWLLIKGDTWDKIGHMVADSVEAPGPTWVRNSGFDEAWEVSSVSLVVLHRSPR
jgi:hypothetical protein